MMLISVNILAAHEATILKLRGSAFHGDTPLKVGSIIKKNGLLKTGAKSFVKISIDGWNTSIVIGPKSKMLIDLSTKDSPKRYNFLKGSCRWITRPGMKSKGVIYTKQASLGVRGTDYIIKANPLLEETEIIVFSGLVDFKNINNVDDVALLERF